MRNTFNLWCPHCKQAVLLADESAEKKESMNKTLYLGMLFGGWYLFNIYFNM